ncbi:Uncharacterised protein [BD1-7 clade bacterium]|uniref:DSBA-like thioredoxin domain-containing protein n=1 Tax=BD1-7 clade bacterium TaxID=2029982 RepID=A0A5S9QQ99_9GAMM|nr:Uncharacterised protein [BD1-7 clade bacterium]
MNTPVIIHYYTDILCVWAWIAQRRNEELVAQWGDQIEIRNHVMNLFGSTSVRMQTQWKNKGGFDGFARHVQEAAAPYEDAKVHEKVWSGIQPQTSGNAHLVIKAVELTHGAQEAEKFSLTLRKAFFEKAIDIGDMAVLKATAKNCGYKTEAIRLVISTGEAMALMLADYQEATRLNLTGSPSWILDNGRQTLYGNVGFRVLNANIEELLKEPAHEASWC